MTSTHIRQALDESGNTKYWVAQDANGIPVSEDFRSYRDALYFQRYQKVPHRPQIKVTIEELDSGKSYESVGDLHAGDHLWAALLTNTISVLRGSSGIEPGYFEKVIKEEGNE